MGTLHPFSVHFPIVLVILWPILDAIGLAKQRPDLSKAGLALLIAAALSSLVASVTGQSDFDSAVAAGVDPKVLETHADAANVVPWALFLVLFTRVVGVLKWGVKGHWLAITLGVLAVPLVLSVGKSGGELVRKHGIGVERVEARPPAR
ncbi:DUF2231 domain-containing protein [Myxococcota bacterium]|nr:DUF2231 domain-containing protein [Myxococcota bacterium]